MAKERASMVNNIAILCLGNYLHLHPGDPGSGSGAGAGAGVVGNVHKRIIFSG